MTPKTKVRVAWDVDLPPVHFADRVVARAVSLEEASQWAGPDSRVIPIGVAERLPVTIDSKRYRSFAIAAAAAAAFVLYIGGSQGAGQEGNSGLLEAIEPEQAESFTQQRSAPEKVARSLTSGGNSAVNPEAGAGVW